MQCFGLWKDGEACNDVVQRRAELELQWVDGVCPGVACGYDLQTNVGFARALYARPELAGVAALRDARVFAFDANAYFSRPAPRLLRGAELLRHVFADGGDLPGEVQRVRPG